MGCENSFTWLPAGQRSLLRSGVRKGQKICSRGLSNWGHTKEALSINWTMGILLTFRDIILNDPGYQSKQQNTSSSWHNCSKIEPSKKPTLLHDSAAGTGIVCRSQHDFKLGMKQTYISRSIVHSSARPSLHVTTFSPQNNWGRRYVGKASSLGVAIENPE